METVIEAFSAKNNASTPNYNYEWLGYQDEDIIPITLVKKNEIKNFTNALIRIFNKPIFNKIIDIDITSKSEVSNLESNTIIGQELISPLMPPKKVIDIEVVIESIEKGTPSIFDEILEL